MNHNLFAPQSRALAGGVLLFSALLTSCGSAPADFQPDTIISLERATLDRWGKGDPTSYLDLYAPDITYFDPTREKRAEGLQEMKDYYAPLAGKIHVDSFEMIDPKVQRTGDAAVLSYQLASHGKSPKGVPYTVRWNSTKVYFRMGGQWKIVHDHWSYIKPDLRQAGPE